MDVFVKGEHIFKLKNEHGFPLEMSLHIVINENNLAIEWVSFIEAARNSGWWDFQIYEALKNALDDSLDCKVSAKHILDRFKIYVLKFPHPKMIFN